MLRGHPSSAGKDGPAGRAPTPDLAAATSRCRIASFIPAAREPAAGEDRGAPPEYTGKPKPGNPASASPAATANAAGRGQGPARRPEVGTGAPGTRPDSPGAAALPGCRAALPTAGSRGRAPTLRPELRGGGLRRVRGFPEPPREVCWQRGVLRAAFPAADRTGGAVRCGAGQKRLAPPLSGASLSPPLRRGPAASPPPGPAPGRGFSEPAPPPLHAGGAEALPARHTRNEGKRKPGTSGLLRDLFCN